MPARPRKDNTDRPLIAIPKAIQRLIGKKRWLVWRWERDGDGKPTKVPYCADRPNEHASSTDQATWCVFSAARRSYAEGHADGIGFALRDSGFAALDLDDCRNPETGELQDWARDLVRLCGSYAEVTPSRCGLRIIGKATETKLHRKFSGAAMQTVFGAPNGASVEIYCGDAGRYITVTGDQIEPVVDKLADIGTIAVDLVGKLDAAKTAARMSATGQAKMTFDAADKPKARPPLEEIIKRGHYEHFGNDRSRAVWFVINALIGRGDSDDEIVTVLTNLDNAISAHVCSHREPPQQYALRQIRKARAEHAKKRGDATGDGSPDSDGAEIARLAVLTDLQYEKERKAAAERLGCRASIIDRLVQAERDRSSGVEDRLQGRAISFPEPELWPEPVDGVTLLDDIAQAIGKHIVMSEHAKHICALWVLHTYLTDCFQISPRLGITSPVKRCGKTTLLDVLERRVSRPLLAANVSSSAIFRVVEGHSPTLLIDEADTFVCENNELRGILNSGHRKGGSVLRTVGDDFEPRMFSTYGACAIATIGALPGTLADRSVTIELKRRLPKETVTPFRSDRIGGLQTLARRVARWTEDNRITVASTDPTMPEGIINREADNWRPLLQIASVVGGKWPERAAAAAKGAAVSDEESRLEMLIDDIRTVFPEADSDGKREVSSIDLVARLVALEGKPWAEMGRNRKPLTANGLARMLKPLSISPEQLGPEDSRFRGYAWERFAEAFSRYLPAQRRSEVSSCPECDEIRTSELFEVSSPTTGWTDAKCEKPNNDGILDRWTVAEGESGEETSAKGRWPGLSPRAVAQLAREVAGLGLDGAARIEAEIRRRLASSGVPPEAHDIEVEKVVRHIEETRRP